MPITIAATATISASIAYIFAAILHAKFPPPPPPAPPAQKGPEPMNWKTILALLEALLPIIITALAAANSDTPAAVASKALTAATPTKP